MTTRRKFLQKSGAGLIAGMLPLSLVKMAFADDASKDFTIAYISDAHIQQIKGNKFVRNWDQGLKRAVAEANLMEPKPDFVVFGGDLAQIGNKPELDHGAEILSGLIHKTYVVMGEHDYYLDLGEYWSELYGKHYYSFDHKGVHFVVLNSIITHDEWTYNRWESGERRMAEMAGLDNPNGSPFMIGNKQFKWLKSDLKKVAKDTPVVVFSHSPLQKIYKGWNFWTEEAEDIQALLNKHDAVNVVYGHVHQIQYNQINNIAFTSVMSTAWPWPYPAGYAQAESHMPVLTVPMNRADLGKNGVVCAQCHPNAVNTHPETYPKFQKQLGKVAQLWEMINWCIRNPLEGENLAADDPKMTALQAYIVHERRGIKLEPGKH